MAHSLHSEQDEFQGKFYNLFWIKEEWLFFLVLPSFVVWQSAARETRAFNIAVFRRPIKFNDKYAIVSWIIFFIALLLVYFWKLCTL